MHTTTLGCDIYRTDCPAIPALTTHKGFDLTPLNHAMQALRYQAITARLRPGARCCNLQPPIHLGTSEASAEVITE